VEVTLKDRIPTENKTREETKVKKVEVGKGADKEMGN
jgi:hypothetical protein